MRKFIHKILGLNKLITQLNDRVTLIENIIGINNFMSIGEGNVGVGSTVPPDVARYQELAKAQDGGNVGVGSTAPAGNVGVGSTAPAGNVGSGNVGSGNVGVGSSASTETQSLCPPDDGNVGDGNVGSGNV